ncbi:MAG: manganese efflux pump MntP family protein [Methanolinea sp.]|nr:manganese efflux pump MntP family protein [Methanolinea sp.]
MEILLVVLIGISLAIDCFAVSISAASSCPGKKIPLSLVLGTFFGVFQAGMILAGYFGGSSLVGVIGGFDHWVAFGILCLVGGKMVYEGLYGEEGVRKTDFFSLPTLGVLSLATSMDALGVGLSLAFIADGIFLVALGAGLISFLFAISGVALGDRLALHYGKRFEVIGGLILVAIGIRILTGHLAPG